VNAKGEVLPPVEPDEETFKVLKLWRGDENQNDRPKSIEVEIFCNGISYKTVTLSEDNHWAYTWSAKNDGSNWTVVERNIPQGYTMTVEERQATFVLTNTRNSTDPDEPPKTGDTMNILLYVLVMVGSGSLLIILGMIGKKKRL
jgi:LPXTG-motif cell wall-anchored protein